MAPIATATAAASAPVAAAVSVVASKKERAPLAPCVPALVSAPKGFESLAAVRNAPALVRAFATFDRLGQGYVSAQEFRDIFEKVGEIPAAPETVDDMLAFADPDETGQVYYEPFVARLFAGVKEAKDAKEAALKK